MSPSSADIGMSVTLARPSDCATAEKSAASSSNTARFQPTWSILFTATTTRGMASSDATAAWRRVCCEMPRVASTRITDTSAVEDPVTMLRVYCSCPGLSAMMKRRLGVAK